MINTPSTYPDWFAIHPKPTAAKGPTQSVSMTLQSVV